MRLARVVALLLGLAALWLALGAPLPIDIA